MCERDGDCESGLICSGSDIKTCIPVQDSKKQYGEKISLVITFSHAEKNPHHEMVILIPPQVMHLTLGDSLLRLIYIQRGLVSLIN
jgi:hypothetical protein